MKITMKLKKFKEKDKKRIGIIVFTVACILLVSGVVLYRTFAIFEVKTNQNVIKGTVQDPGNIYFAFYYDGGIQKDMPVKDNGYVLDEEASYCGVNGSHDDNIKVTLTENYVIQVHGVTTSRTKCNLYFVKGKFIQGKGVPFVEKGDGLYEVSHANVSGIDEGFKETEYRFAGSNPNNYITFNEELWRIIGLVNVLTSDNIVEERVKIIRNESIGNFLWDKDSVNDWSQASLMEMLNNDYYNSLKDLPNCYQEAQSTVATNCNFLDKEVKGLNELSRRMIDEEVTWNLGASNTYTSSSDGLATHWYGYERGINVAATRPVQWKGAIALMYPSDFGYATSGGSNLARESCLSKELYNWNDNSFSDCKNNDWLYDIQNMTWTLATHTTALGTAMYINDSGYVRGINVRVVSLSTRPVVYLKSNVIIQNDGQDGSYENPYHLQQIYE